MTVRPLALVPPGAGRQYRASRLVRLSDVLPSGEARLDAVARYLQDVAADDGRDAGIANHMAWLVRKTVISLRRRPHLEEPLDLVTWASGSGARWAERRTTISILGDPVVEAASLWVCVDLATMRPSRLPDRFWTMYGEAVGDRVVSSRLRRAPSGPLPVDPAGLLSGRGRFGRRPRHHRPRQQRRHLGRSGGRARSRRPGIAAGERRAGVPRPDRPVSGPRSWPAGSRRTTCTCGWRPRAPSWLPPPSTSAVRRKRLGCHAPARIGHPWRIDHLGVGTWAVGPRDQAQRCS